MYAEIHKKTVGHFSNEIKLENLSKTKTAPILYCIMHNKHLFLVALLFQPLKWYICEL